MGKVIRNAPQEAIAGNFEANIGTTTPDEIVEIIDVPEAITATEVGLWFMQSDVELMRAYSTSDFDEIDRILMERKAFVSSVALLSYDKDVAKIDYQSTK